MSKKGGYSKVETLVTQGVTVENPCPKGKGRGDS